MRTCIGALSFAVLILKLFSREFLKIGIVYTIYGVVIFLISLVRLNRIDVYFTNPNEENSTVMFRTGGFIVLLMALVSLACYICLLIFAARI